MKDRISAIMEHEQMTQAQFAAAIGIQRAAMSHIMSGRNNASLDVVQRILNTFPDIAPDWLLFGKGEMMRSDSVQPDLFGQPSAAPAIHVVPDDSTPAGAPAPEPAAPVQPSAPPVAEPSLPPKHVTKIMIFYSDNTFEVLRPSSEKEL